MIELIHKSQNDSNKRLLQLYMSRILFELVRASANEVVDEYNWVWLVSRQTEEGLLRYRKIVNQPHLQLNRFVE